MLDKREAIAKRSKDVSLVGSHRDAEIKSAGRSLRNNSDNMLPNYLPASNRDTINAEQHTLRGNLREMAVQTDYQAVDVQSMFLRRLDEFLGMKAYRPVSPLGQPRLPSQGQDDTTYYLANAKNSGKAPHGMRWSNTRTRVGNVSNVDKMRKFEPMRLRTLEKRHKFENRSLSPNAVVQRFDLQDISDDSPDADRHSTSLLQRRNSSGDRSLGDSPENLGPGEPHDYQAGQLQAL